MGLFVFLIISHPVVAAKRATGWEIIRKRDNQKTPTPSPSNPRKTHMRLSHAFPPTPPTSHTRAQSAWRGASSQHHPSAAPRNGLHDWLNRLTIALAKKHRIGVADVTDAVMAFAPAARGIRDAPGLRSPEGDYILPCRPAVATLLAAVAQRVCSGCGRPWG